jgi:DDE family transposase
MPLWGRRIDLVEGSFRAVTKGISQVQLSHRSSAVSAVFDEPSLVSAVGLVPVVGLAERAGLRRLADQVLSVPSDRGANAGLKVASLVAGMVAGADSIEDVALLRHGGMGRLFDAIYAPSTLGSFLREFRFGHVRQLDAVAARVTANLARAAPLLPGADQVVYVDVDDTVKQTYGYRKQGAGYGYTGVKGLNALLATVSTPLSAPVIVASRLRRGSAHSGRGAARLVADALTSARACGATGLVIVRADSAFYAAEVVAAIRRGSAYFSITARKDPAVQTAIASISEDAWTPIRYPNAIFDDQLECWVSDAEVAEVPFTAFTSKPEARQVAGRLIVRRVRDANPDHVITNEQGELFPIWRHHAVFTDSPLDMLDAEADHRRHAVIEQVIADLKNGPLAHLPSGKFMANSAWLVLAVIAFNLLRAAGALASRFHARATTGTLRAQLISIPARITRSARRIRLRLPANWPWQHAWQTLFAVALSPPTAS